MKTQILSDAHFEYRAYAYDFLVKHVDKTVDLLVLAGDIVEMNDLPALSEVLEAIQDIGIRTLWVPGNHENYGTSPQDALKSFEMARSKTECPNLTFAGDLPGMIEVDGHRVLYGTGWYERSEVIHAGFDPDRGLMYNPLENKPYQFQDFRQIVNLSPWCYEQNSALRDFLERECRPGDIVVTHHMPSRLCAPVRFRDEPDNCFFSAEFDEIIHERKPALWIFGHTHDDVDLTIDETRCFANPVGYPNERERRFPQKLWSAERGILEV